MVNNLSDSFEERKPSIVVIGVGGAGGNAVNNMIRENMQGVHFMVCNTDAQDLAMSLTKQRLQLGPETTEGLGAGADPSVGKKSAEESREAIKEYLKGRQMAFITAGMGGGTGTGAAPVIAEIAREQNILTIGVVTKPFNFEGLNRSRMAEQGIIELQKYVHTLIVIPNQNLFRLANSKTSVQEAFRMADDVLYAGVRGITDLVLMPGLVNLDFADVRTVVTHMGKAVMGTGQASGEGRSIKAAEMAISNPLLEDVSMAGAQAVLINITGGINMTLHEMDEAVTRIKQETGDKASIIFGTSLDESLTDDIRVSVIATGIGNSVEEKNAVAEETEVDETPSYEFYKQSNPQPPTTKKSKKRISEEELYSLAEENDHEWQEESEDHQYHEQQSAEEPSSLFNIFNIFKKKKEPSREKPLKHLYTKRINTAKNMEESDHIVHAPREDDGLREISETFGLLHNPQDSETDPNYSFPDHKNNKKISNKNRNNDRLDIPSFLRRVQ